MNWKHVDVVAFGGPENLHLVEETALPEPQPGQVRVKVLTAGTGFTDTIIRKGQYPYVKTNPPFTLGYDWFGMVDKAGADATTFKVGDYVADMPRIGGYAQRTSADGRGRYLSRLHWSRRRRRGAGPGRARRPGAGAGRARRPGARRSRIVTTLPAGVAAEAPPSNPESRRVRRN